MVMWKGPGCGIIPSEAVPNGSLDLGTVSFSELSGVGVHS